MKTAAQSLIVPMPLHILAQPLFLFALIASLLPGCVERTITVTSEPQGALVYLNDQEVGRTPVTVPFTHYGVYDVRLEKDGYHPLWTKRDAQTPWWDNIGPDLFAEAVPDAKSEFRWHLQMQPKEEESTQALLQRARTMQQSTTDSAPTTQAHHD